MCVCGRSGPRWRVPCCLSSLRPCAMCAMQPAGSTVISASSAPSSLGLRCCSSEQIQQTRCSARSPAVQRCIVHRVRIGVRSKECLVATPTRQHQCHAQRQCADRRGNRRGFGEDILAESGESRRRELRAEHGREEHERRARHVESHERTRRPQSTRMRDHDASAEDGRESGAREDGNATPHAHAPRHADTVSRIQK